MRHPFVQRILASGKRVVEVNVYGLSARQWRMVQSSRLAKNGAVYHASDINGVMYVTGAGAAKKIAAKFAGRGLKVETTRGKIDSSGISHWFEPC